MGSCFRGKVPDKSYRGYGQFGDGALVLSEILPKPRIGYWPQNIARFLDPGCSRVLTNARRELTYACFEHRTNGAGNQGHYSVDSLAPLAVEPFVSGAVNCPADRGSEHISRHSGPIRTLGKTLKHNDSNRPGDSRVQQRTKGSSAGALLFVPVYLFQIITNGKNNGFNCARTGSVKIDVALFQKLVKVARYHRLEQRELVGVMVVKGRSVDRSHLRNILHQDFFKRLFLQQLSQRILKKLSCSLLARIA